MRADPRIRRLDAGRPDAHDDHMEGLSELLATADELYGLIPEAFTAARDERARSLRRDGSRARALAVKELRRPSAAAWLVNALVRHRSDEVEEFLRLGAALREAQESLDAEQLRELNRQRQTLLAAIGREARALARELGRPVSEQVADEVEETLRAGLADPAAANAVRSGRLTASLRYAGFGETDVSEVMALPAVRDAPASTNLPATKVPATTAPATTVPGLPAWKPDADEIAARETAARQAAAREAVIAVRAAEEATRRAQGAALVAEQHRDGLVRRARSARERLDIMQSRVAELESMVAAARESAAAAAAGWAPLHAEADAATARAEAARGLAESARATLAAARAHLADVEREER